MYVYVYYIFLLSLPPPKDIFYYNISVNKPHLNLFPLFEVLLLRFCSFMFNIKIFSIFILLLTPKLHTCRLIYLLCRKLARKIRNPHHKLYAHHLKFLVTGANLHVSPSSGKFLRAKQEANA